MALENQNKAKLLELIETKDNDEALTMLQKVGSNDLKSDMGIELLHCATYNSNDVVTQYLIDSGVNVNAVNKRGDTPLMTAIKGFIDEKTIKNLLDSNADIYHIADVGLNYNILQWAISLSWTSWNIRSLLLERLKNDCSKNSDIIAEKLLAFNCKIHNAVLLRDTKVLEIMLSRVCSVSDSDDYYNRTALHVAVMLKDLNVIKFLLRNGADINARSRDSLIPVALACDYGESAEEYEILNYLLDHGSVLSLEHVEGIDQKGYILGRGKKPIVRTLIARQGFDFKTLDNFGKTGLYYISRNIQLTNNNQSLVEDLRQHSIGFNILSDMNERLLLSAAALKNFWLVCFLLENGVNVNEPRDQDVSALFLATTHTSYLTKSTSEKKNIYNLIELLLQYGADPQFVTTRNHTVLDSIKQEKSYDLAKPILAYLVLHANRGGEIFEVIQNKIHSNQTLKELFELCQRDLQELKRTTFNESLTGFNLLFDSEKKIRLYARNEEVFDLLTEFYSNFSLNSYFYDLLKQRLEKIFTEIKVRRKVSDFLCRVLRCDNHTIPDVIDKIIDYLDDQDLQNVIQVDNVY